MLAHSPIVLFYTRSLERHKKFNVRRLFDVLRLRKRFAHRLLFKHVNPFKFTSASTQNLRVSGNPAIMQHGHMRYFKLMWVVLYNTDPHMISLLSSKPWQNVWNNWVDLKLLPPHHQWRGRGLWPVPLRYLAQKVSEKNYNYCVLIKCFGEFVVSFGLKFGTSFIKLFPFNWLVTTVEGKQFLYPLVQFNGHFPESFKKHVMKLSRVTKCKHLFRGNSTT